MAKAVKKRYKRQRSRGTQGFGFYVPGMDRLTHNTREQRILRLLKRSESSEILYHHRWPTSTDNVRNACHPFSTKTFFANNYVLVHNGMIWNDVELSRAHAERGISYISAQSDGKFNDSEALLWDVALYLEGEQDSLKSEGDIAFVLVQNDAQGKPKKLYFARNGGSPLYMMLDHKGMNLASEIDEDNKASLVPANTLYSWDYETYKLEQTHLEIPEAWDRYSVQTYGAYQTYSGYTPPIGAPQSGRKWWDDELGYSVPDTELTYGSDSYWMMISDKAESLAFDLMTEGGIDHAISEATDMQDSIQGKLNRIIGESKNLKPGSKKFNKLAKERTELWTRYDVASACLDELNSVVDSETRIIMGDKPEDEQSQIIADVEQLLAEETAESHFLGEL